MIWVIKEVIKIFFIGIIRAISYALENFEVLFLSIVVFLSVAVLKINFQPYSYLVIILFFIFTIADLKKIVKDVAQQETIPSQVLVLCIRMVRILFSIVIFYAMAKSNFMSGQERPASYVLENLMTFIVPELSKNHQFSNFMMIISYLLWLGCFTTCVCMQPKEKEKSILREIFEDDIGQSKNNSEVRVQKSQFSVKRISRKGYLNK